MGLVLLNYSHSDPRRVVAVEPLCPPPFNFMRVFDSSPEALTALLKFATIDINIGVCCFLQLNTLLEKIGELFIALLVCLDLSHCSYVPTSHSMHRFT